MQTKKPVEQVLASIEALDLGPIKFKLMDHEEGQGWSREYVETMEVAYKRFLSLLVKYPDQPIAPTKDIDKFWHGHILDTMKYAEDCQDVFGGFLHHFPYFGMRGEEDAKNLARAGDTMARLYSSEYEEAIPRSANLRAADEKKADAAFCWAAGEAQQQDAAFCWAAIEAQKQDAAFCWAAIEPVERDASFCWAAIEAQEQDAAFCWAAIEPVKQDAAFCWATVEPVKQDAAFCWATVDAKKPRGAAFCWASLDSEKISAAFCWAAVEPTNQDASFCWATVSGDKPDVHTRPTVTQAA